ncbi:MAG TPA: DNA repair protein RecO [Bacillota bacterium]|nr:DNA repair protein RecO [Bacillota bacterium]
MSTITTKAFVMNSFPWKERHRLLHLLTPGLGLITVLAPASERLRSEIRGATQLFSLSEFTLTEKQSRYAVRTASVIESFIAIAEDLDRLAAASHAAEVFLDVAKHDEPNRETFDLWAYSLYEISVSPEPVFISRMAAFRLMVDIGLKPCLESCVRCGGTADREPFCFSFSEGGLLCGQEDFRKSQAEWTSLTAGTVALLRYVASAPYKRLFRFFASPEIRSEASGFADRWLEERMEKRYRRLAILDQRPDIFFS